ncbi:MAG: hypothetical protein E7505_09590, partial [Ruminococcus sp.]|nr:hypothetical protein [Ruminococcus sp.]
MPISLIRDTKDKAMHGTDNDRNTGCGKKMKGAWYTREGELKDITDLTCERCKEVFATKMIRESNKEESRLAKEEKKRYMRAKKQGAVKENTYEEYLMNREAEASAKRDSHKDDNTSAALQALKDAIPVPQQAAPVQQPVSSVQIQPPFDPYAQQAIPPQNMFNPYAQPAVQPQSPFDPYAQPVAMQPQKPFDPYAQSVAVQPQKPFDPYAQTPSQPFAAAPEMMQQTPSEAPAPVDDSPAPSYQEYIKGAGAESNTSSGTPSGIGANDDFLAQFMLNRPSQPVNEAPAPSPSPAASDILSATDDILSQFNIGAKRAEEPAPSPELKADAADASSFYNDSIPVVGAEYAGASSVNSVSTEFGSLNVVEPPADEFVVPDVPVYNPTENNFVKPNISSRISASLDELVVPDVSSLSPAQSKNSFSSQLSDLDFSFSKNTPDSKEETESVFDKLSADVSPVSELESVSSMKFEMPDSAAPTMNSFESVTPVQPVTPTMNSFESVTPVQPVTPTMNSFESVTPVQPVTPTMNSFESVTPVQPVTPTMNSFESVTPVQPAAPTMNSFESVTPVQPVTPTMNSFESVTPVQPVTPTMNSFESV